MNFIYIMVIKLKFFTCQRNCHTCHLRHTEFANPVLKYFLKHYSQLIYIHFIRVRQKLYKCTANTNTYKIPTLDL